jgi:DNA-binding transcriptional ArsR family regulator
VPVITDRLRNYATAIADPTRGMILLELDRAGELTATQLARRLELGTNNVYHHMRVLLSLGVVDSPRLVPGPTYVEKFYRINPELNAALRLDPTWFGEVQHTMTAEDRQALLVGVYLTMANVLRQAARHYGEMDAETLDRSFQRDHLNMTMINRVSREHLHARLEGIRTVLENTDRQFAEDLSPRLDVMLLAALPSWWDAGAESAE